MPSIILTHTTRYKNRHADGGGYYSLEIQITLDVTYRIKFSHRVPAIRSYPIIPIERYICDIPYIPQHMLDAIRLMHLSEGDKNGEKLYAGLVKIFSNTFTNTLQEGCMSGIKKSIIPSQNKSQYDLMEIKYELTNICDKLQKINTYVHHQSE